MENYEIVFKHSDFGEVKGGSGTTSGSNAYAADEFDSVYKSIFLTLQKPSSFCYHPSINFKRIVKQNEI